MLHNNPKINAVVKIINDEMTTIAEMQSVYKAMDSKSPDKVIIDDVITNSMHNMLKSYIDLSKIALMECKDRSESIATANYVLQYFSVFIDSNDMKINKNAKILQFFQLSFIFNNKNHQDRDQFYFNLITILAKAHKFNEVIKLLNEYKSHSKNKKNSEMIRVIKLILDEWKKDLVQRKIVSSEKVTELSVVINILKSTIDTAYPVNDVKNEMNKDFNDLSVLLEITTIDIKMANYIRELNGYVNLYKNELNNPTQRGNLDVAIYDILCSIFNIYKHLNQLALNECKTTDQLILSGNSLCSYFNKFFHQDALAKHTIPKTAVGQYTTKLYLKAFNKLIMPSIFTIHADLIKILDITNNHEQANNILDNYLRSPYLKSSQQFEFIEQRQLTLLTKLPNQEAKQDLNSQNSAASSTTAATSSATTAATSSATNESYEKDKKAIDARLQSSICLGHLFHSNVKKYSTSKDSKVNVSDVPQATFDDELNQALLLSQSYDAAKPKM